MHSRITPTLELILSNNSYWHRQANPIDERMFNPSSGLTFFGRQYHDAGQSVRKQITGLWCFYPQVIIDTPKRSTEHQLHLVCWCRRCLISCALSSWLRKRSDEQMLLSQVRSQPPGNTAQFLTSFYHRFMFVAMWFMKCIKTVFGILYLRQFFSGFLWFC